MNTIFTKIIMKEIPANIVFEDHRHIAFHSNAPAAPIHIIIISKYTQARNINDLDWQLDMQRAEVELSCLFRIAKLLAQQLGIDKSGYRLTINNGPDAGQQVQHLHLHLLGGQPLGNIA